MEILKRFLLPAIMVGILVLSGCETYGPRVKNGQNAKPSLNATMGASFPQTATIPTGKAVVYIYRPGGFTGGLALPFGVKVNGKTLITLVQNGYYAYLTEPGQIEFTTFEVGFLAPSSVFSIIIEAKAQQTYYLKGAHGKGAGGRASLQLVSPEEGTNEIANCQLISSP